MFSGKERTKSSHSHHTQAHQPISNSGHAFTVYCLNNAPYPAPRPSLWEADNVENIPRKAAPQPEGRAARAAPRGGGTPAGRACAVRGGRGREPPPRLLPARGAHALWRRQGRAAAVAAGGALPRSRSPSPSARALPPCCCEPLAAEGGGGEAGRRGAERSRGRRAGGGVPGPAPAPSRRAAPPASP